MQTKCCIKILEHFNYNYFGGRNLAKTLVWNADRDCDKESGTHRKYEKKEGGVTEGKETPG